MAYFEFEKLGRTDITPSGLMKQSRKNIGEGSTKKDNHKNNAHNDLQEPT